MGLFKKKSKESESGPGDKKSMAIAYRMKRKGMAHGGRVDPYSKEEEHGNEISGPAEDPLDCEHGGPLKCAMGCYSEGGMVANEDEITAGFKPNSFDDLALRDDLESSYTGANSGDELSNEGEDERRRNMVDRIMLRKRKQSNPRPG